MPLLIRSLFSSLKLNVLYNEMVISVQKYVEDQNTAMQGTLMSIDDDLSFTSSTFESVSDYRRKFIELYNNVTTPKFTEGESMETCVSGLNFENIIL